MFVILNRKRLESSLPDMSAPLVVAMVSTNMRRQQPLHPTAEITIAMRPEKQVKMVCHETKPNQSHRHFLMSFAQQFDKSREILVLVKNITSSVATVQDVVDKFSLRSSCGSWHEFSLTAIN
jgi:hypothetical protein